MGKYVHKFANQAAYNQARNNNYIEPWVSYTDGKGLDYNKSRLEKLIGEPLTFEVTSSGVIKWYANNSSSSNISIQYNKNGDGWITISSNTGASAPTISVVSGDVVQFRGDNVTYCPAYNKYSSFSETTCTFRIKGNIMSLINTTDFADTSTFTGTRNFSHLFYSCTGLTDAENLILPATTLTPSCYDSLFLNCSSLSKAPQLPATTLASSCYNSMFYGTAIIKAPVLLATTLASNCYTGMFQGCSSLTEVQDVLPAMTLESYCYDQMFHTCSSLSKAPQLPATTLAEGCYNNMFRGCTGLTSAPDLPATTLSAYCYASMFYQCTNIVKAPDLPATTVLNNSYAGMFRGCSSLNYIKCLATDISASQSTYNFTDGVAATGTFVKDSTMLSWTTGVNGIPSGWTVQTASS